MYQEDFAERVERIVVRVGVAVAVMLGVAMPLVASLHGT
jgi:hypothetical protein